MRNDDVVVDGELSWDVVHAQLTKIAKRRAALDADEARWLRHAEALQIWKPLGMVNALDYLERTLGYAPHAAHERLRVARSLAGLPQMELAFAEGRLGFSAVRELTRVATPATEAAWVDAAVGKSLREIEPMVADHQPGDHPDDPPTPELRTRKVSFELPPETYAVFRQAHQVLDDEHGRRLEPHELIDVLARRAIAAAPVSESTGRATFQIAVMQCPCCKQAYQEGGGELVPVGAAVVERAACDAQWIGSIADGAEARVKASQGIPPATVRFVHRRDHGRCRVPGCRSTRCLEIHHIIHRADGGTNDIWNLILVCSSCHQAHHDGRLAISGTADKLAVVRPAEARSHVGSTTPLGDAIARAQAKATLRRLGWKAQVSRTAIDRVVADLPPDADAETIVFAALKLDLTAADATSPVGRTERTGPDAASEARSGLVNMGWSAVVARAAVDRAAAELPRDASVEALVRAALRHCPAPLHTKVSARDGAGPTWNLRLAA
jgi:Holliday junction resolvasome RuvABC DNA-binding subunit